MGRETGPTVLTILDNQPKRDTIHRQRYSALFSTDEELLMSINGQYHSQPLIREQYQYENLAVQVHAAQVLDTDLQQVLDHKPVVWTKRTDYSRVDPVPLFENYLLRYKESQMQEFLKGRNLRALSAYRELVEPVIDSLVEGNAKPLSAINRFLSLHPQQQEAHEQYGKLLTYLRRGPGLVDEPIIRYHLLVIGASATGQKESISAELQPIVEKTMPKPLYKYEDGTYVSRVDEGGWGPNSDRTRFKKP